MKLLSLWSKLAEKTKFDVVDKIPELYEKAGSIWAIFLWIFLPFLESWFSPIPLTLLVTSNITAAKGMFGDVLGYFIGYLCSYIGEALGAISVFLFIRYVVKKLILKGAMKSDRLRNKIESYHNKVEVTDGVGSLFILVATPFAPSALVNIGYGMSSMKVSNFVKTILIGKAIMILLLALFTKPFELMMDNLLYMIIGCVLLCIAWVVLKMVEPKIHAWMDRVGKELDQELEDKE
jgi:uncharacterized membrane protein YdjX (TVP38/TMEM64 family)